MIACVPLRATRIFLFSFPPLLTDASVRSARYRLLDRETFFLFFPFVFVAGRGNKKGTAKGVFSLPV